MVTPSNKNEASSASTSQTQSTESTQSVDPFTQPAIQPSAALIDTIRTTCTEVFTGLFSTLNNRDSDIFGGNNSNRQRTIGPQHSNPSVHSDDDDDIDRSSGDAHHTNAYQFDEISNIELDCFKDYLDSKGVDVENMNEDGIHNLFSLERKKDVVFTSQPKFQRRLKDLLLKYSNVIEKKSVPGLLEENDSRIQSRPIRLAIIINNKIAKLSLLALSSPNAGKNLEIAELIHLLTQIFNVTLTAGVGTKSFETAESIFLDHVTATSTCDLFKKTIEKHSKIIEEANSRSIKITKPNKMKSYNYNANNRNNSKFQDSGRSGNNDSYHNNNHNNNNYQNSNNSNGNYNKSSYRGGSSYSQNYNNNKKP